MLNFLRKTLQYLVIKCFEFRISWFLDDEKYLKIVYPIFTGSKLNLEDPKTFNEKLQWLKLHDRKDFYSRCADKLEMKSYVEEKIGPGYTIPTLHVYKTIEEINIDELTDRFVMKTTHDSGGVFVCDDKAKLNTKKMMKKLNWSLKRKYYYLWREWPYKNITPRIICEEKIGEANSLPDDYKVLCFNGSAAYVEQHTCRNTPQYNSYIYDRNGCLVDFNNTCYSNHGADQIIKCSKFNEIIRLSELIAKDFVHIRVDFYVYKDRIYVGELTFYDGAGMMPWKNNGDVILGELLDISRIKNDSK